MNDKHPGSFGQVIFEAFGKFIRPRPGISLERSRKKFFTFASIVGLIELFEVYVVLHIRRRHSIHSQLFASEPFISSTIPHLREVLPLFRRRHFFSAEGKRISIAGWDLIKVL
jgi:hypothetical protein